MAVNNERFESILHKINIIQEDRKRLLNENYVLKDQLKSLKQSLEKVEINKDKKLSINNNQKIDQLVSQIDDCLELLRDVASR